MKVALVNPPWTFHGSLCFCCRKHHLTLELGYARAPLSARGHARGLTLELAAPGRA